MDKLRNDGRIVDEVRVVVHTLGAWPNGLMSDNHWSIYLLLAHKGGSVRMNMTAEADDPKGTLKWSPDLVYTDTASAIQRWDYKLHPGVTVGNVYRMVMEWGRDQYSMSGGGSGCRYWVYIIIKDFESKGWLVMKSAGDDLWPKLLYQYSNTGHIRALPMVQGKFTSKSSSGASTSATSTSSRA